MPRAGASARLVVNAGSTDTSCDTSNHIRARPGSVQRSFRLSSRTLDLLDKAADASEEARNALADRLLGDALRLQRHPLIRFQDSAGGAGSRLLWEPASMCTR